MTKRSFLRSAALVFLAVAVGGAALLWGFTRYATPTQRKAVTAPIYTVGDRQYDQALAQGKRVAKLGPLPLGIYRGGVAFPNRESASRYREQIGKKPEGWGVYRLSGDFRLDTYKSNGQTYINKTLLVVEDRSS